MPQTGYMLGLPNAVHNLHTSLAAYMLLQSSYCSTNALWAAATAEYAQQRFKFSVSAALPNYIDPEQRGAAQSASLCGIEATSANSADKRGYAPSLLMATGMCSLSCEITLKCMRAAIEKQQLL